MFILEQRFGNDGYAFWFKMMELLSKEEGHYLDMNDPDTSLYMASFVRLSDDQLLEILSLCASLDIIDEELWEKVKIIWCPEWIDSVKPLYRKRQNNCPERPTHLLRDLKIAHDLTHEKSQNSDNNGVNDADNTEEDGETVREVKKSRVKESKVEKSKVNKKEITKEKDEEIVDSVEVMVWPTMDDWWDLYDKKIDRKRCAPIWEKYGQKMKELIMAQTEIYIANTLDKKFRKNPLTYLNNEAWKNEIIREKKGIDPKALDSPADKWADTKV